LPVLSHDSSSRWEGGENSRWLRAGKAEEDHRCLLPASSVLAV
jgi:hypothetical protein